VALIWRLNYIAPVAVGTGTDGFNGGGGFNIEWL